jgi:hypothetical protein
MVCGADSINDVDLLRHGGMRRLFTAVRAPPTLGTFLRLFTFGHVRLLDAAARLLARRCRCCPARPTQVRTSAYRDLADAAAGNDDENLYLPAERAGEPVEPMDDPGDGLFVQC